MLNSIKSVLPPLTSTSCQGRQNPPCIALAWQFCHQSLQTVCSELLQTLFFCSIKLSQFSQGTRNPFRRISFGQHEIKSRNERANCWHKIGKKGVPSQKEQRLWRHWQLPPLCQLPTCVPLCCLPLTSSTIIKYNHHNHKIIFMFPFSYQRKLRFLELEKSYFK